jgi:hypothetical protein
VFPAGYGRRLKYYLFIPQMYGAAGTIPVIFAVFAYPRFCPSAIPHDFKPVIPNIQKRIAVYVSLNKTPVNTGAGGDRSADQNRSDI